MIRGENSRGVRIRARLLGLTVGPWGEELGWRGIGTATTSTGYGRFLGKPGGRHNMVCVALLASSDSSRGHLSEFVPTGFLAWWAYEMANSVIMMSL